MTPTFLRWWVVVDLPLDPYAAAEETLTRRQEQRLARLELTVPDFLCFRRRFVGHPFCYITRRGEGRWYLVKDQPLSNELLISHLEGRDFWVGTGCRRDRGSKRFVTDHVVIDLDAHMGDMDLRARYDRVTRVLGRPSLLFRSSRSGGFHLYYFLSEPVELHRLRAPDGRGGAVMRLLAAAGLLEVPGSLEVYPRGHYRNGPTHNRIRLPFGAGSRLLDPDSLLPNTAGTSSDLRLVRGRFDDGTMETLDVVGLLDRAAHCPAVPYPTACGSPKASPSRAQTRPPTDLPALWATGLTGPKQLNRSVSALGFDLHHQGIPQDVATDQVVGWLHAHHNGQSGTYNRSPDGAVQEVKDILARIYRRRPTPRHWGPVPGLSAFEMQSLLHALDGDAVLADPETGELASRFKAERLAFELLGHAKQWVLATGSPIYRRIRERSPDATLTPATRALLLRQLDAWWPDPTQPEFVVPVPYNLRLRIDGISENLQTPLWHVLLRAGLFRPRQPASVVAHRCATFAVTLDFGAWSVEPTSFVSLEAGLVHELSSQVLRQRYSRHYVQRIRRAGARSLSDDGAPEDPFALFIAAVLQTAGPAAHVAEAA